MNFQQVDPQICTHLIKELTERIYEVTHNSLDIELRNIISTNSRMWGNTQRCLGFRGHYYSYGEHPAGFPSPINLVKPEMRVRLKQYLDEVIKTEREKELVIGYIRSVLTLTKNKADILALLPGTLAGIVERYSRFLLQGPATLSPETIALFTEQNSKYLLLMKSRLTYNLLEVA